MIRFGYGFLGILALITTILIIYCIHFGIIMLLWKIIAVEFLGLPMINFGQTIGLWLLVYMLTHKIPFRMTILNATNKNMEGNEK